MDFVQVETTASLTAEITQIASSPTAISSTSKPSPQVFKNAIRISLQASTVDSILAAVFSLATSGILLGNFLVELDASPIVFGMLSSIPMLVNLIQPLGAYLSERTISRFNYSLRTFGVSRLLWLILGIGIIGYNWGVVNSHQLVILTLLIVLITNLLGGLGCASWLSWIAMIVPRRLRGRYFGLRNSAASLTNLICAPIAGLAVSHWYGGTIEGYGVVLLVSIVCGIVGLACQYFKIDLNPQAQNTYLGRLPETSEIELDSEKNVQLPTLQKDPDESIWKNPNFVMFLAYYGLWTLAVNICTPFFNLYMLDTLGLDVSVVTIYNSLQAAANLLMLILWGKLADKTGNRSILIFIGILVAVTPFLWLGIGGNHLDVWLWLPLLHILGGGTWAAIDLCTNNIQIGIAPIKNQSSYFAIAAAIAGFSGALGTTIGGFIAQFAGVGGLLSLFAISGILRLGSIVPLVFVKEPGRG